MTRSRVKSERRTIASAGGELELLILHPTRPPVFNERPPGILWIHGGGYSMGMPAMAYFSRSLPLVEKYGAVEVVPRYRLSWKAPYPAALDDCYTTLLYLRDHADELNVEPRQLFVAGESSGGGLAVAVCMAARERGDVAIAFQMPLYPMIDDRDTPSSSHNHEFVWNTWLNHRSWHLYLSSLAVDGHPVAGDPAADVPPTAAPARQTDYTNLPPCYTFVGTHEPFYCETLAYVRHLREAGVEAVCDVFNTGVHAFDMLMPWRRISHIAAEHFEQHYLYAVTHYFTD